MPGRGRAAAGCSSAQRSGVGAEGGGVLGGGDGAEVDGSAPPRRWSYRSARPGVWVASGADGVAATDVRRTASTGRRSGPIDVARVVAAGPDPGALGRTTSRRPLGDDRGARTSRGACVDRSWTTCPVSASPCPYAGRPAPGWRRARAGDGRAAAASRGMLRNPGPVISTSATPAVAARWGRRISATCRGGRPAGRASWSAMFVA